MSCINFELLVEQLLNESLGRDMMDLLSMPGSLTLEKCAVWASLLDRTGVSYLKIDTLLGLRPAWPIIDTLFFIFRVLQNSKIISNLDEAKAKQYAELLNQVNNVEEFYTKLIEKSNKEKNDDVLNVLKDKVEYLLNNYNNYREYSSTKLKQITDQTQVLAAEEYLNLTPYDGIISLLREYGGYDIKLIKNILNYPGETRYTQKENIEGPVLGTIVEISKLMLLFYREYIIDQKEKTGKPVVNSVMEVLGIENIEDFKKILDASAGKLSPLGDAGRELQRDYINFVDGKSVFTIDPNVLPPVEMPMEPPKPAIGTISDFRNIAGISQEIYQAFLSLFNNIRKGTHPSKWSVAGKNVYGGIMTSLEAATQLAQTLAGFSGHSLYGKN